MLAASDLTFAVETGSKEKADLVTSLAQWEPPASPSSDLDGSIATTEVDPEAATAVRVEEQVDFAKSERELLDVFDTLAKAMRRE